MWKRKKVDDLSVEELEQMLRLKKRQSRIERFSRLSQAGRAIDGALVGPEQPISPPPPPPPTRSWRLWRRKTEPRQARPKWMDRLLLGVEVIAVGTLLAVLVSSYASLQTLNTETALAQQQVVAQQQQQLEPTAIAPISLRMLPGGHSSPTSAQGAVPDVPVHLQQWIQPGQTHEAVTSIQANQTVQAPTRIIIPKIKVDAPIVSGVGWEDLKKGVGHLPGSANPGERGNLYLAAHNDIYGEIFRYLEALEIGDEYTIYAGEEAFHYVVKEKRIIEPSEVEVMLPTTEPVSTLQTCYPYLIDTHRLVVIGELAE